MGLSEPSETVDDKLAVVAGYLDAYLNDGDSRSLLSPVASRLATHITMMAEADDPGRTTVGRAQVLGPFHWHRYLLMPEGDNRDAELSAAIRYLAALAGADLALVTRFGASPRDFVQAVEFWAAL